MSLLTLTAQLTAVVVPAAPTCCSLLPRPSSCSFALVSFAHLSLMCFPTHMVPPAGAVMGLSSCAPSFDAARVLLQTKTLWRPKKRIFNRSCTPPAPVSVPTPG